jgi:predicted ATPase
MNVDAGIDYRLRTLTAHLWLSPLNNDTQQQMDKLWLALAGRRALQAGWEINHRRCRRSAWKTRRWRRRSPRCAWMPAASMTILPSLVCITPSCY